MFISVISRSKIILIDFWMKPTEDFIYTNFDQLLTCQMFLARFLL